MARARTDHRDRDWLHIYVLPALAILAGLALAVWLLDLVPPTRLSLAAGRPGGAYYAIAEQYQRILARDGIRLDIIETAGSVENAERLARGGPADAAFLQGGVEPPEDAGIEALSATFLEPLWIFPRRPLTDPADPAGWQGLRIAAGEPGSGTRFVVQAVLAALRPDAQPPELVPLGGLAAAEALLAGQVDAALFVAPVGAPYLQPLFESPATTPAAIRDGEALVRRLPFAQLVDIPPAGLDYAARNPPERIELIAMVGRLVARPNLHPALVDRLVNAAREVHSGRDLITAENQFPTTRGLAMPVDAQAKTMLARGPSPLYRFLPYWVVAQINSFALLLLPVLVLLFPLFRVVPGLYDWRMRARVYRHYVDLCAIDDRAMVETDPSELARLGRRLDAIEADMVTVSLPLSYREYAYTMRMHIELVRARLAARLGGR